MIDGLLGDIRYGVRALAQRPGFTAVALLALALGIGANSAIFSVVNAVLLRPLPYKDPDRIVMLWQRFEGASAGRSQVSPPEFVDYQSQSESFEQLAAYLTADVNLTGGGEPERMSALVVSPGLHILLGAQPILGRTFLPEEAQPGRNLVALVSHGLWQRRFGGDPNLVGEAITINGRNRTVVGIMAPGFRFPQECDLWLPLAFTAEQLAPAGRGSHFLNVIGRLKSDVKIQQAEEEVKAISSRFPGGWISGSLVTLRDQVVGDLRPALLVLWGAVGFVLLICCANVANLLLARAAARQKEIAIRCALGARRVRIVRQLFTESLLLSVLGGGLGVLVAMWGIPLLVAVSPDALARTGRIEMDGRAIGFTLAVSILTGLIFGLAPALQASKPDLNDMLKEGKGSAGDFNRHRIRSLLAISEIALALLLSVGAGLTIKSFVELMKVEMGFSADHVLAIDISLPGSRYSTPAQQVAFYKQLLERVETLPDARYAGLISDLPLSGANADRSFVYEGMPAEGSGIPTPGADYRHASPRYFQAMSIPLLTGRCFTEQDAQDAPRVAIVNETLARHIWPNEDPVGK
jgi:putative ABC transport system permease protein